MRILDIAPCASLPPVDGASKRAWQLYEGMVSRGEIVTFVGSHLTLEGSKYPSEYSAPRTWRDRKFLTALIALLTRRDYWQLRTISSRTRRSISHAVRKPFDAVIVNFLYAVPLLKEVPKPYRLLIDTHNFDPACFRAIGDKSRNPLLKLLCRRAARLSERVLRSLPLGSILMHVSERDSGLYRQLRPDLRHIVVENGTSIRLREVIPDYAGQEKRILIFVGNLSAKMNYDALKHFATRFWPSLREYAGFRVVGSHPPAHVEKLCETKGWKLYANVSEDCLQRLYSEAHFAALPFAYGEGSKLKLFEACGRGVPALSTHCGVVGVKQLPALVTVSDDPQVWRKRVIETRSLAETELDQLIRFAEEFSWSKLAEKVLNAAQDCPAIA